MNPKLTAQLQEKHPQILKDLYGSVSQTGMAFGLQVGDGWYDLLDNLCTELETLSSQEHQPVPIASQVKEKWGLLCFYVNSATDKAFDIIDKYERLSQTVCESCGQPGTRLTTNGWLYVRCPSCAEGQV